MMSCNNKIALYIIRNFICVLCIFFLLVLYWLTGCIKKTQVTYLLFFFSFFLVFVCFLVLFCFVVEIHIMYFLMIKNFSYALYLQEICFLHWIIICIIILLMRFVEFYPIKTLEHFL